MTKLQRQAAAPGIKKDQSVLMTPPTHFTFHKSFSKSLDKHKGSQVVNQNSTNNYYLQSQVNCSKFEIDRFCKNSK